MWLDSSEQMKQTLGIEYDTSLNNDPKVNCSLPANNGGMCSIYYC